MDAEEREEYARLREAAAIEADAQGRALSHDDLARLQQQAAANVAERRMTEG